MTMETEGVGQPTFSAFRTVGPIDSHADVAQDILDANYVSCRKRGLPDFFSMPGIGKFKNERIAICGGGPSLADHIEEIQKFPVIIACGTTHSFFRERGLRMTYATNADAAEGQEAYFIPHVPGVRYLMASTCSPELFDGLRDADVWTWNNQGAVTGAPETTGGQWVGGGATVVTRSIMLAVLMGYQSIDLFGFDCAFRDNAQHAYPVQPWEEYTNIVKARAEEGGREFLTSLGFFVEAQSFMTMIGRWGFMFNVRVHGDGLVAEMMKVAQRKAGESA